VYAAGLDTLAIKETTCFVKSKLREVWLVQSILCELSIPTSCFSSVISIFKDTLTKRRLFPLPFTVGEKSLRPKSLVLMSKKMTLTIISRKTRKARGDIFWHARTTSAGKLWRWSSFCQDIVCWQMGTSKLNEISLTTHAVTVITITRSALFPGWKDVILLATSWKVAVERRLACDMRHSQWACSCT